MDDARARWIAHVLWESMTPGRLLLLAVFCCHPLTLILVAAVLIQRVYVAFWTPVPRAFRGRR